MFFKLLPADTLREAGQAALSVVAWTALAGVLACQLRDHRRKLVAFATVLLLSLVPQITSWDTIILGESVAISITVGLIALWWMFAMAPSPATTALVCATSVLWAFLRHTNVMLTVPIAIMVAVSMVRPNGRRLRAVVLATLVVILAWGIPTLRKNDFNRDEVLATIVSERILTSPERTAWFVDHGMPDGEDVRKLAGSFYARGFGSGPIRKNKRLFHWIQTDATSTYFEYLVTHPTYTFGLPLQFAIDPEFNALSGEQYSRVRAVLPKPVADSLFGGTGQLVWLAVVSGVLALFAFGVRGWTRRELFSATALVLSLALYWITFHGVASEPLRHYLLAAVAIRVSLLLVGALALDQILTRRVTTVGAETAVAA